MQVGNRSVDLGESLRQEGAVRSQGAQRSEIWMISAMASSERPRLRPRRMNARIAMSSSVNSR
jgi:hypothetical protein